MGSMCWGREIAEVYDRTFAAQFDRSVVEPMIDLLADLAQGGRALEFAVRTGRVALPLSDRKVAVQGIELSPTWWSSFGASRARILCRSSSVT